MGLGLSAATLALSLGPTPARPSSMSKTPSSPIETPMLPPEKPLAPSIIETEPTTGVVLSSTFEASPIWATAAVTTRAEGREARRRTLVLLVMAAHYGAAGRPGKGRVTGPARAPPGRERAGAAGPRPAAGAGDRAGAR